MNKTFQKLAFFAAVFALCVIVLGAYVRLSDAGLGCPDWPGCYGRILVPEVSQHVEQANEAFPERPVEAAKAWKEMIHRYFASTLGLIICVLAVMAWRRRHEAGQPVVLPILLVGIVIFQGLLGMWTVTLLLKPVIVMLHLIGGMITVSLLFWVGLRQGKVFVSGDRPVPTQLRSWALLALVIVLCQIALGGWTSANYAALACPDFPTCQTQWWPAMNFAEGFTFWRGIGIDYEGGVLDNDARVAVHMMHRIGAVITFIYILVLGLRTFLNSSQNHPLRYMSIIMLCVLLAQISLGIANIVFALPISVAVFHNGMAVLLLLSVVGLNHLLFPTSK